jgi:hypothetical protein
LTPPTRRTPRARQAATPGGTGNNDEGPARDTEH